MIADVGDAVAQSAADAFFWLWFKIRHETTL